MLTARRSAREAEPAFDRGPYGCSSCAQARVQGRLEREILNEDTGLPWPAIVTGAIVAGGIYYVLSRDVRTQAEWQERHGG